MCLGVDRPITGVNPDVYDVFEPRENPSDADVGGALADAGRADDSIVSGSNTEDVSDDSTQQTLNRIFGHALLMASYVSNGFRVISGLLPDTHFLGKIHADHIVFEEMFLCFQATGQHLISGEDSENFRDAIIKYEEFVRSSRAL